MVGGVLGRMVGVCGGGVWGVGVGVREGEGRRGVVWGVALVNIIRAIALLAL